MTYLEPARSAAQAPPATGTTVYDCEPAGAELVRRLARRRGVAPAVTAAAVSEASAELAAGTRCVSVGHKTPIGDGCARLPAERSTRERTARPDRGCDRRRANRRGGHRAAARLRCRILACDVRPAFVINTGRGPLLDTDALLFALESGRLGGAALDVLEGEEGTFYAGCRNFENGTHHE